MDCVYNVPIPSKPFSKEALAGLRIDFDTIYRNVVETTLETFATHNSASVQATLYIMCEKVLRDNADVADIKYELPNKVSASVRDLLPCQF